jgi:hypothetical protein
MSAFLKWHKNFVKQCQASLGVSDYGIMWLAWVKGLIIGWLIGIYLF